MARSNDDEPKTKPGVTGFKQEYNQDPGPRQDLNPDVVDDPDALPKPLKNGDDDAPKRKRGRKAK